MTLRILVAGAVMGALAAVGERRALAAPAPGAKNETASTEPTRESPEAALGRARQSYARSDYAGAVSILRPLLYPEVRLDPADEVEARRLLALSDFLLGARPDAESEFNALLQLAPDLTLDPLLDPPEAARFLDDLKRKNREKLDEIAAQRRRAEEDRQRDEEKRLREKYREVVERTVEKHWYALNFVPFGVGQFQNGQHAKGWALASTEAALGAASLGLWLGTYFAYGNGVALQDRGTAQSLQIAQIVVGGLFWAEVAGGIIDAMVHYVPTVVTERKIVGEGGSHPVGQNTRVVPFLTATGGGVAVQGAF